MKTIETLTAESFAPYGTLIDFAPDNPDTRYQVRVTEAQEPWCLAIFRVTIRQTNRLECHPTSMESFIPLRGSGVLLVACPEAPQKWQAFLLDKPICLNKGVWHEVIALSEEALYQITENRVVNSEFYQLAEPVSAAVGESI